MESLAGEENSENIVKCAHKNYGIKNDEKTEKFSVMSHLKRDFNMKNKKINVRKGRSPNNIIAQELDLEELEKERKVEDMKDIPDEILGNDDKSIVDDYDMELSSNEPIRELFTAKNIKYKTEITDEQRGAISILLATYFEGLSRGFNLTALKSILDQYIDFGVAVGRKGREEYVDAHKSQLLAQQMQNQMNKPSGMENMKS